MVSYHICPICKKLVEVKRYNEHFESHEESKTDSWDKARLERIMQGAKKASEGKDKDFLFFSFEVARRAFCEIEGVDTYSWNYVLESDYHDFIENARITVPSPYPPTMCHIKFRIKDKQKYEELLRKYRGTETEILLKEMVSRNIPTIVVYDKNLTKLVLQWKSEGMTKTEIIMLIVYFFLHEMYHILGFGEKDSTIKASVVMHQVFRQNIGIPEHEIQRWKHEEFHQSL